MKSIAGLLLGTIALALLGAAGVAAARYERRMADAQQEASTGRYAKAAESLDAAEGYLQYGRWVPGFGRDAMNEVSARKAALQYWQRQYDVLVPAQAEPVSAVDETNGDLQLVVANGAFRVGQERAKDRETLIKTLDETASGYLTVLKNNWHEDAAYNFEYIVRLRDEMAKGRKSPPEPKEEDGDLGEAGSPAEANDTKSFKIYIPLQGEEKNPEGGEAGKSGAKDRKG